MKLFSRAIVVVSVLFSIASSAQDTSLTGNFSENSVRSKWGSSYFSFSSADVEATEHGFPALSIYNYLSLHYKYSKDQRFSIRPAFQIYTSGYDKKGVDKPSDAVLSDLHLNYSNYSIALLPGDWELSGQVKLYFPTSEGAQERKTITWLKGELISEKLMRNGWIAQYTMKPGYWFHSQRAYRDENEFLQKDGSTEHKIEAKVNKWGELNHYVGIGKYINSVFTPKLELGFIHEWNYNSEYVEKSYASRNQLKIAPNTEIHLTRKLWFVLGVENTVDLNDTRIASNGWQKPNGQSIKLFEPENTQYYLMTFLSL